MRKSIPTYDLSDISRHQFVVEKITLNSTEDHLIDKGIHRDSHYIFTIMESGHVKMMVDFNIIEAQDAVVFCVLPGQVHQGLFMKEVSGWFVAVKTDLVPDLIRQVFEESLMEIKPLSLHKDQVKKVAVIAELLRDVYTDEMLESKEGFFTAQSLLNSFMGTFAQWYSHENSAEVSSKGRMWELTRDFRILVRKNFKSVKSPSAYAEFLNISRGYLTEAVHEITGKSTQHWIHQEILMEAKRLLVFTSLTIKEIAYEIGYSDHTYFSRLFSKLENLSPSEFRDKNKK
ncbi:helix-turn-helix domain-containing protein [Chryseobacterium sp. MYb264]|uniref:helix-turn-helix domain-containing protein n=1 Tax=Chryseobacterium sp. MYb264 TaxID=2745153 RepID=UPI002E116BC3|nr:helix-turn-helix domain-containing protein [Chryseobacterium sp. MYb264]